MAAQLTWLANKDILNLPEDRRHERVVPDNRHSTVVLDDGRRYNCKIIDISLSGAAIELAVRPAMGTPGHPRPHARPRRPPLPRRRRGRVRLGPGNADRRSAEPADELGLLEPPLPSLSFQRRAPAGACAWLATSLNRTHKTRIKTTSQFFAAGQFAPGIVVLNRGLQCQTTTRSSFFVCAVVVTLIAFLPPASAAQIDIANPAFAEVAGPTSIPVGAAEFCKTHRDECSPNARGGRCGRR